MKNIKHGYNFSDKCIGDDVGRNSGANPIACNGNELLLTKSTPLSEMIWSQQEGLSVQDVASSIGEKKASLLWNTDSFSMVVSSPICANDGEFDCRNANGLVEESFGDLKISNNVEVGPDKEILGNYQSCDREVEKNTGSLHTLRPDTDIFDIAQDKGFISGPDIPSRSAQSFSKNFKELRPHLLPTSIMYASDTRSSHNHQTERDQIETCGTSNLTKAAIHATAQGSKSSAYVYPALNNVGEYTNSRMTRSLPSLYPIERNCYGKAPMVDFEAVLQQSRPEGNHESLQASCGGKSVFLAEVGNLHSLNSGNGEEQAIEECESSSEDSHDSVESCNSKRLMPSYKRERSYDLDATIENKRLRKQICGGSNAGSSLRQESSFMNWVSTITNGFSQFTKATPLAFIPPPSLHHVEGSSNCLSLSHAAEENTTCRNTGFKSIFQSLYLPGFKGKNNANIFCRTHAEATKELEVATEQFGNSSSQVHYKKVEFNLHRILPSKQSVSQYHSHNGSTEIGCLNIIRSNETENELSTPRERLNKFVHQVKKSSSTINDTAPPSCSSSYKDKNCKFRQNGNIRDIGGEGAGALVVAGSSSKVACNNRNELLQNLWITRFCPKDFSTTSNSAHQPQGVHFKPESLTNNCNVLEPQFPSSSAMRNIMNDTDAEKRKSVNSKEKL